MNQRQKDLKNIFLTYPQCPFDQILTKKGAKTSIKMKFILMLVSQLLNKSLMSDLDISDAELDLTLHFEDEDSEEFDIEEDSDGEY